MTDIIHPVILCGGSGTRLWPLSRAGFPKQFLALAGTNTLFQQALERTQVIGNTSFLLGSTYVITNEEHRFLALDQFRELNSSIAAQFILEPAARNTAPALTLAALAARDSTSATDDPILVVTPADQTVRNFEVFNAAIRAAMMKASDGAIVVMGIQPTHAETGYGYIQRSGTADLLGAYVVSQFTEKPTEEYAKAYVASGDFFWNGGIFVLKASIWLKAISEFRPDIYESCQKAWQQKELDVTSTGETFIRPNKEQFLKTPSDSIDYAVIEKCPNSKYPIAMVPLDAEWSDLGTWDAVWKVGNPDVNGNVTQGDVLLQDTKNSFVTASNRLVSVIGLEDVAVIETADAVLVARRDKSQDVKTIVSILDELGREEKNLHRKVHLPWGWYDSVDEGKRFKVKRIMVKPGASLSLQSHQHRAEHWIVVKGIAEVVNGENVISLKENQSTYIAQGTKHRISNPGKEPLEIIEVQSGSYLGEDDIERFEDLYQRTS